MCFSVAERLEARATEELKSLLTIQREAIRVALLERRLTLGPAEPTRDLTKKEVLEQVIQLAEKADAHRTRPGASHSAEQSGIVRSAGSAVR
jgi:hypothetical protein